jgi:hypothetical protein
VAAVWPGAAPGSRTNRDWMVRLTDGC